MGKTLGTSKHSVLRDSGAAVAVGAGYIVSDGLGGYKFSSTGPGDIHIVDDGAGGYEFDSGASASDVRILRNGTSYLVTP